MKLLMIGGTMFLGRHTVQRAIESGHEVTIFTRGKHNPDLFPEAKKLHGDRNGDLSALRGGAWDAIIDTCGYIPRGVTATTELLADAIDHYTFISSISVYPDLATPGIDETAPVATVEDETVEEVNETTYGALKALCEQAAERAMPGRVLTIRPGLIVGPHDPTDRFTYWPHRIAQGGAVIAPGSPDRPVQIIDARDLAEWTLRMVEAGRTGVFNATGPDYQLTMRMVVDASLAASGSQAEIVWVAEDFLLERNVTPWSDLPLWLPDTPEYAGFDAVDCRKAFAEGLTFRSVEETVADTLAWDRTLREDRGLHGRITRERESELLREWAKREATSPIPPSPMRSAIS
jgi:nucleoside-diphosphate-sugar epimerase